MNPNKRGVAARSSKASAVKNTTNKMKDAPNCAQAIKGAIGMKPSWPAPGTKVKGTVSG